MKVRISTDNIEKLADALRLIQGNHGPRGQNHISANDLIKFAEKAEIKLNDIKMPMSKRPGASYKYEAGGASANSYRYPISTTHIEITRGTKFWYLACGWKVSKWPRVPEVSKLEFGKDQITFLLNRTKSDLYSGVRV